MCVFCAYVLCVYLMCVRARVFCEFCVRFVPVLCEFCVRLVFVVCVRASVYAYVRVLCVYARLMDVLFRRLVCARVRARLVSVFVCVHVLYALCVCVRASCVCFVRVLCMLCMCVRARLVRV